MPNLAASLRAVFWKPRHRFLGNLPWGRESFRLCTGLDAPLEASSAPRGRDDARLGVKTRPAKNRLSHLPAPTPVRWRVVCVGAPHVALQRRAAAPEFARRARHGSVLDLDRPAHHIIRGSSQGRAGRRAAHSCRARAGAPYGSAIATRRLDRTRPVARASSMARVRRHTAGFRWSPELGRSEYSEHLVGHKRTRWSSGLPPGLFLSAGCRRAAAALPRRRSNVRAIHAAETRAAGIHAAEIRAAEIRAAGTLLRRPVLRRSMLRRSVLRGPVLRSLRLCAATEQPFSVLGRREGPAARGCSEPASRGGLAATSVGGITYTASGRWEGTGRER